MIRLLSLLSSGEYTTVRKFFEEKLESSIRAKELMEEIVYPNLPGGSPNRHREQTARKREQFELFIRILHT